MIVADLDRLRSDPRAPVVSLPAKLVAGLIARRAADAAAITMLSCDNLPRTATVTGTVVGDLAALVDESLPGWIEDNVDFATSMVDRITPVTTDDDRALVERALRLRRRRAGADRTVQRMGGLGRFPAGRPQWEDAGVTMVDDVVPFEQRKLWLLNGSHSHAGLRGSIRGHETIERPSRTPRPGVRWRLFWDEASRTSPFPASHRRLPAALLARFSNPRVRRPARPDRRRRLDQATRPDHADAPGRAGRGRMPIGCATTVAAWICTFAAGRPGQGPRGRTAPEAANSGDLPDAVAAVLDTLETGPRRGHHAWWSAVLDDHEPIEAKCRG